MDPDQMKQVEGVVKAMYTCGNSYRVTKNGNQAGLITAIGEQAGIHCVGLYAGLSMLHKTLIDDKEAFVSSTKFTDEHKRQVAKYLVAKANTSVDGKYAFFISKKYLTILRDFAEGSQSEGYSTSDFKYALNFRRYFHDTERKLQSGGKVLKYSGASTAH